MDRKPSHLAEDDNTMAACYIDWDRGQPYTYTMNDVDELQKAINTKYAFARKIKDPKDVLANY